MMASRALWRSLRCTGSGSRAAVLARTGRSLRFNTTTTTTTSATSSSDTTAVPPPPPATESEQQNEGAASQANPPASTNTTGFVVPNDVPPVRFVQRYSVEPINHMLAIRTARAYSISNETLRAHIKVSMHDKTKKKGRPRDPIRGMVILPHLFKPAQKVIVFARGKDIDDALEAGATAAGLTDLMEQVVDGDIDFDVALATADVMRDIRAAGRSLRQRMPSAKNGTIVENVKEAVLRFSRGMLYRTDAHGNVNIGFGKADQSMDVLQENLLALTENVLEHNLGARDKFIEQMYISSDHARSGGLEIRRSDLLSALAASKNA
ncbi:hypothetical protein PTSG_03584 [Salpingoeca rosetta]|uniref:50S ribosomal protein L1 n=1 Tax=Salpingoeca rosetta (strain ATCC 50818 / BSB-021) TaxID=946362 RepID=F2U608_SALR5|nr:uncharacterized protein PTSG_03584 [Salpingoeca rosetta]EGD82949.1 hypothetical protein PTSG_03584 [Salpingoeca rosetta]|eukprot:XP_004995313.1 hypothetical protein PTSG_03584 [Salpingoeca rosetta]